MRRPSVGNSPRLSRLTQTAQQHWEKFLSPGDWAVDATAGTGRDTVALAHRVHPGGHVFALDVQDLALRQTGQALAAAGLLSHVTLLRADHSHLPERLPCQARGRIGMVCFNLGYLPGGDHSITTTAASTLAALRQSLDLIRPGGGLSVVAYRGHPGAGAEADAVDDFFVRLPGPWRRVVRTETGTADRPGPVLHLAEKVPGPAA